MQIDYKKILQKATEELAGLKGHTVDVLSIAPPIDLEYAKLLSKVISKLSPLTGNLIEHAITKHLNITADSKLGEWIRQDPGFPDAIFKGKVKPTPGIEIKTWFPLATEITARFKDSVSHFSQNQTNVAVVAWLPEHILFGKPKVIDIFVGSAKSIAEARDRHYHRPPGYIVVEPEDTTLRTVNLQQSNTNGFRFQGTPEELKEATKFVNSLGKDIMTYSHEPAYQEKMRLVIAKYRYRLDTNFAKIDRIEHEGLEKFKLKVLNTRIEGHTVKEWAKLIASDEQESQALIQDLILEHGQARQDDPLRD